MNMMWIGLLVGAVGGYVFGGGPGALIWGFLGWLAGVIANSMRTKPGASPAPPAGFEARVARLEEAVTRMEAQLASLPPPWGRAGEGDTMPPLAESPPPVPLATVETSPEPVAAPEPSPFPPEPPKPSTPNPIIAWLTGGNAIARIGSLILFFGLAFLLKYAADRNLVPVELRVAGVAAVGVALLVFGWRLRDRRRGYALGLQGAGVAVLYLTTFAALRLYHLLPPGLAFGLLAAIAVFSAILAIRQDALVLAVFGAGGGFLAPILASTGAGSHVTLFSYYVLLNLGIAGIAWFKAWRGLNLLGFAFTFFIGLAWGARSYQPEHFATVEPFLAIFFVMYVAIAVLYARRQAPVLRHYVDGTLVFGVPLAAFGLQAALTRGMEFALAYSCVAAAAFYLILAAAIRQRELWRLLSESFLALGVVFASLAIPLALDARWTSAAWALEGAAIVWAGIRQSRTLARAFGLLLQVGAGGAFLLAYDRLEPGIPWIDAAFVGAVLLAVAGLWTSRLLGRDPDRVTATERQLAPAFFLWGLAWWLIAGHHDIVSFVPYVGRVPAYVVFVALTAAAFSWIALRRGWREAAWPALALAPVLAFLVLASAGWQSHPFASYGWAAWPIALGVAVWTLRRHESDAPASMVAALHVVLVLAVALLGALELHWAAVEYTARGTAWSVAGAVVIPAALLLAIASPRADGRWPVAAFPRAYRVIAASAVAAALLVWVLYANFTHDGRSDPLPYLPLLNALDLGHVLVGLAFVALALAWRRTSVPLTPFLVGPLPKVVLAAAAFLWLNGVLLRTLHHTADIPYRLDAMMRSVLAQASLSVFWSVLALGLMVWATRRARRTVWMVGAALMGVVVVKLFLVDLSHVGGIERIVSFIAVGLLMLVVGYFAPVPPRAKEAS